jgi:hypothetical protein
MLNARPRWIVLASFLCAVAPSSCSPGRDGNIDSPGSVLPDLGAPACFADSLRCSADQSTVQACQGGRWTNQQRCQGTDGQVCRGGRCVGPCDDLPAGSTGCSFYPVNLWSTSSSGELGIVASNTSSTMEAVVTLEDVSGVIGTQTAPPGGLVVFRLDHGRNKLTRTEQARKGFHLKSSAPVAAYLFHPIDAAQVVTGSATLLLPEQVMAKDYFVMGYTYNAKIMTSVPQGQGFVAVLALADNTQVQLTVPVATQAGAGIPALAAGGTLQRTLNRMEVLEVTQANSLEDISGAVVKASANVVVFGGAGLVTVPASALGGDHLGVQMFPRQTWGKHSAASKFKQRNSTDRDYYRVLASVDSTQVTFTGGAGLPAVQTLRRGQFFEFDTDGDFEITADQPILALQYLPAWGNLSGTFKTSDFPQGAPAGCPYTGNNVQCLGDANMSPLAPVEQYRSDYIFYVPQTYAYNYVNVTAPLDAALTLDGTAVSEPLRPLGSGVLGRAILRVMPGNHRISADKPFGLLGYGYGYAISYCYPGGLNLQTINPIPG